MGIMPFIGMGIFIVILAVGIVVFSYLLILGAAIGLILFGIFWIYQKLTARRRLPPPRNPHSGRTIDHD